MNALQFPLRLSASTFALTWEHADGVDELPAPLYTRFAGTTPEELAESEAQAFVELVRLGVAPRNNKAFMDELEQVYRQLAQPAEEYYGWMVRADGSSFSVLVACAHKYAVLAIVDGDEVLLDRLPAERAAQTLVSVLPECPAAQLHSASARTTELFGERNRREEGFAMPTAVRRSADAGSLHKLLESDPPAKGQLYVAVRDPRGARRKTERPMNYMDHERGRVLFYTSDTGGGEYLTAMPGRSETMVRRLRELREELLHP